ncbi:hypothetical protein N9Z77_00955 [Akkermansiaceae bacterium]|nr:hypothetical protein [Akkermansiaceae bacterium]
MGKLHSLIGYVVVACAFSSGSAAEGLAGSDSDLPAKKWLDVTFAEHATGPLLLDVFRPDDGRADCSEAASVRIAEENLRRFG